MAICFFKEDIIAVHVYEVQVSIGIENRVCKKRTESQAQNNMNWNHLFSFVFVPYLRVR